MPKLPDLGEIPQAQFDKIVSAFPGSTVAEKTQAYKDWSINRLIDRVQEFEMRKARNNVVSSLPVRPPEPEFPTS